MLQRESVRVSGTASCSVRYILFIEYVRVLQNSYVALSGTESCWCEKHAGWPHGDNASGTRRFAVGDWIPATLKRELVQGNVKDRGRSPRRQRWAPVGTRKEGVHRVRSRVVGWHLRDEGSFAQVGVGGPVVGDELPLVPVMGPPKHKWGLLRTSHP